MSGTALITETDDVAPTLQDIPRVDDGQIVNLPQRSQEPAEEYDIIETDDAGKPLGREAPLTEEAGGVKPLVQPDQKPQHAPRTREERRNAQRQGRDRTMRENESLRAELAEMRQVVAGIEPRLTALDRNRVQDQITDTDRQIASAQNAATIARRQLSEAITASDGEAINAALEARDAAADQQRLLAARKTYLTNSLTIGEQEQGTTPRTEPQRQAASQPLAPLPQVVRDFVADFSERHEWYRPDQRRTDGVPRDLDTRIVLLIDNDLANEGFDQTSQDYWDELEDRVRERLPHRFQQAQETQRAAAPAQRQAPPPERRGPMTGGAADRAPTPGRNQVYISPDRKAALIQAGVLERDGRTVADKVKFNRMLKSYADYDRENGAARA